MLPYFTTQINIGNKIVFRHSHYYKYCNNYTDQTYDIVQFEVPPGVSNFKFSDGDALKNAKAIFSYWATGAEQAYFFQQGNIEGKKLTDNSWQITATLLCPVNGDTIAFSGNFKPN